MPGIRDCLWARLCRGNSVEHWSPGGWSLLWLGRSIFRSLGVSLRKCLPVLFQHAAGGFRQTPAQLLAIAHHSKSAVSCCTDQVTQYIARRDWQNFMSRHGASHETALHYMPQHERTNPARCCRSGPNCSYPSSCAPDPRPAEQAPVLRTSPDLGPPLPREFC